MLSISFPYREGFRDYQNSNYDIPTCTEFILGPLDEKNKNVVIAAENVSPSSWIIDESKEHVVTYYFKYMVGQGMKHVPARITCNGNVIYIYKPVMVVLDAFSLFHGKFKISIFEQFTIKHSILMSNHYIVNYKTFIRIDTVCNIQYADELLRTLKRSYPEFNSCSLQNECPYVSSLCQCANAQANANVNANVNETCPNMSPQIKPWVLNAIPPLVTKKYMQNVKKSCRLPLKEIDISFFLSTVK